MSATDSLRVLADFGWNFFYFMLFLILISTVADIYHILNGRLISQKVKSQKRQQDSIGLTLPRDQMETEL